MAEQADRYPAGREFNGAPPAGSGLPTRGKRIAWLTGAVVLVAALVVVIVVSVSVDDDSDLDGSAVRDLGSAQTPTSTSTCSWPKRDSDWCADQFFGPENYTRL